MVGCCGRGDSLPSLGNLHAFDPLRSAELNSVLVLFAHNNRTSMKSYSLSEIRDINKTYASPPLSCRRVKRIAASGGRGSKGLMAEGLLVVTFLSLKSRVKKG